MDAEKIYEVWASRSPHYEQQYETDIVKRYALYGGGSRSRKENAGKVFGASYEVFVYAFFLGLYANQRRPLANRNATFGYPIQFWGNTQQDNRKPYPKIRHYLLAAAVARSNVDLLALEHGDLSVEQAVSAFLRTLEEYANGGFSLLAARQQADPNYFYQPRAFVDFLLSKMSSE